MRYWALLLLITFTGVSCQEKSNKKSTASTESTAEIDSNITTTFYLIRHADKDLSDKNDSNPPLTEDGIIRAKGWATYFKENKIDAIYTTDYDRTRQTIAFIAKDKNISEKIYAPGKLYNEQLLRTLQGQHVVIVGHSNTIPYLANKMIGEEKYSEISDDDYNNLYIVTFKGNNATAEMVEIN